MSEIRTTSGPWPAPAEALSSAGVTRREAMLAALLTEASAIRRRRRVVRGAGAAVVMALAAGAVVWMARPRTAAVVGPFAGAPVEAQPAVRVEMVATAEGLAASITVPTSAGIADELSRVPLRGVVVVEWLDDRGLAIALAEAGLARGVVRVDGKLHVIEPDGSLSDVPAGVR